MDALKYLATLVVIVFLVPETSADYGKYIPSYRRRTLNRQRILNDLRSCRYAGLTPCFQELPVRCFSRDEKCDGAVFCRRYHDDELGCYGDNGNPETRTFTIRLTSTASSGHPITTSTTTSTTTTRSITTLATSTSVPFEARTSTYSVTPSIHPSVSMTTTSVMSDVIATVTTASPIVGFHPGLGNACVDLIKLEGIIPAAPAGKYTLRMGNVEFTGTLVATAVCTQATVKV